LRIPVLAGASLIDNIVYVGMNRMLGQTPSMPFVQSLSYRLIATTIAGTILLNMYDSYFSERARQHRQFMVRRLVARRPSGLLRKRLSRKWQLTDNRVYFTKAMKFVDDS